ncbi:hypothetical protein LXL04_031480 [Taraxacum kok-saghyz]
MIDQSRIRTRRRWFQWSRIRTRGRWLGNRYSLSLPHLSLLSNSLPSAPPFKKSAITASCQEPPSISSQFQIKMTSNREWMYTKRLFRNGAFNEEFRLYIFDFLEFAYTNATNIQHTTVEGVEVLEIRCPCRICKNLHYKPRDLVELHLCHKGFMEGYTLWYAHGELYQPPEIGQCSNPQATQDNDDNDDNIPHEVVNQMYERFRTLYRWDPNEEERIREGFENTLKDRYRDRMKDARKASAKKARKKGHVILEIRDSFEILEDNTPGVIPAEVWKQLCRKWNTDEWKKKSKAARKNRNKTDSSGCTARHTGGSIGYEEHRLKLKELTGEEPAYMDVFCKVNLTAESKKKYFEGDKEVPLDFATGTAREAAEAYNRGLFEKYGEDPAQHMTGTYSSVSSSSSVAAADYAKSQVDYAKSQEKVNELEQQLVNMQQSMDESQNALTLEMAQMKKMREDFAAFMREFRPSGNPPQ